MTAGTDSLLLRVSRGEEGAVQQCLDTFGALIWSIARRLTPSRTEAEDAVQEIFIDIWKNAHRYDPSIAAETTFVSMIARRRLIDRLRARRRQPQLERLPEGDDGRRGGIEEFVEDSGPDATDWVEVQDEAENIRGYLTTLKPEAREALRLAIDNGMSQSEIADEMNLPLGTVKTHIRRSLQRVRDMVYRNQSKSDPGVESGRSRG